MTVVRLLKDLGQEFGCVGDVYKNTDAQMEALKARAAKLKLKASDAFEVVKEKVEKGTGGNSGSGNANSGNGGNK